MINKLKFGACFHATWALPLSCGLIAANDYGYDTWWQMGIAVGVSFTAFRAYHFAHQTLDKMLAEKNTPL